MTKFDIFNILPEEIPVEEEKVTKPDVFFFINNITQKGELLDFNNSMINSAYSVFIINKFLSMSEALLPIIDRINHLNMSKKAHYLFLYYLIPKRYYSIKYIKATSKEEQLEKLISKHFECGSTDCAILMSKLTDKQKQELIDTYTHGTGQLILK